MRFLRYVSFVATGLLLFGLWEMVMRIWILADAASMFLAILLISAGALLFFGVWWKLDEEEHFLLGSFVSIVLITVSTAVMVRFPTFATFSGALLGLFAGALLLAGVEYERRLLMEELAHHNHDPLEV